MDCQEYRPFLPLFGQTSRYSAEPVSSYVTQPWVNIAIWNPLTDASVPNQYARYFGYLSAGGRERRPRRPPVVSVFKWRDSAGSGNVPSANGQRS